MIIFAIGALVIGVMLVRELPDRVRMNDKVFYVKLYVFSPPLHIGQGAPLVPSKWKPWLDSADKLNRILEREAADYAGISLMDPPPSAQDLAGWKRAFQEGDPSVVAACQESVYYFFTVWVEGSTNRFLYVGNLPGFPIAPLPDGARVGYTCFVKQGGIWKNTSSISYPELDVVDEHLPVHILSRMRELARARN